MEPAEFLPGLPYPGLQRPAPLVTLSELRVHLGFQSSSAPFCVAWAHSFPFPFPCRRWHTGRTAASEGVVRIKNVRASYDVLVFYMIVRNNQEPYRGLAEERRRPAKMSDVDQYVLTRVGQDAQRMFT